MNNHTLTHQCGPLDALAGGCDNLAMYPQHRNAKGCSKRDSRARSSMRSHRNNLARKRICELPANANCDGIAVRKCRTEPERNTPEGDSDWYYSCCLLPVILLVMQISPIGKLGTERWAQRRALTRAARQSCG